MMVDYDQVKEDFARKDARIEELERELKELDNAIDFHNESIAENERKIANAAHSLGGGIFHQIMVLSNEIVEHKNAIDILLAVQGNMRIK